ncbi:MAG: hypothetical protein ACFFBV_02435 [Promethearchaeota archaeon]
MVEDNYIASDNKIKIESELFALVKSITNLNNKYQKGIVNDNFFRKALKSTMNNLIKLNFILKENNLHLSDLLKKMDISHEYKTAITIINRVSSLNLSDDKLSTKNRTFLELPGITSEITSSFITLMDALSLDGLTKNDFIFNLFEELTHNLNDFPGLDDILFRVKSLQKKALNNIDKLKYDAKIKEEFIDNLYHIFKEFQNKITLKT